MPASGANADVIADSLETTGSEKFDLPVKISEEVTKTNPLFKSLIKKLEERIGNDGVSNKIKAELDETKEKLKPSSKNTLMLRTFTDLLMNSDDSLSEDCTDAVTNAAVVQLLPESKDAWMQSVKSALDQVSVKDKKTITNAANLRVSQMHADLCTSFRADPKVPSSLSSTLEKKLATCEHLKKRVQSEQSRQHELIEKIQRACCRCVALAESIEKMQNEQLHAFKMDHVQGLLTEINVVDAKIQLLIKEYEKETYTADVIAATTKINKELDEIEESLDIQISLKRAKLSAFESLGKEMKDLAQSYASAKRREAYWNNAMNRK